MDWEELIQAAMAAREKAYCPYSSYAVGAALEDNRGLLYAGCNVENISFGATICAERTAICKMVSEGGRSVRKLVVVTLDGAFPCGICLQVLAEFSQQNDPLHILLVGEKSRQTYRFNDLLPHAFSSTIIGA